jgi:PAS domain S-box-containing protein
MEKTEKLTTDRQEQADETMQTSLQLLPLIMNNIPQAVFWKDRELVYLGCNQAFAEDAGFASPEEVVGKNDFDMPWKDQANLYRTDDWQVLKNGQPKLNYEEPQTTPGGSTIWLSTSKIPVYENGQIVAVLGMYEDITARKQAENIVQESEERFRRFSEATTEGLVFHEQGKIVDANPAALVIFGLSDKSEFIGKSLLEFLVPESHDLVLKQMQLETVTPYEVQCIRKDGFIFPIETSTRTYKINDRTIRATSVRDITDRKQVEKTLEESEARYSAVVNQANDGVVIIQDNICKYANKVLANMLGYTPEEVQDTPFINYVALESKSIVAGRVKARLAGEVVPPVYEASLLRKDGSIFDAELSAGVIQYQGKSADVGLVRDITERKKTDEALRESEDRFRRFTEATMEGLVFHEQGEVVDVNPAAVAMFGFSENAELIGRNLLEFIVPDYHKLVLEQMKLESVLPYEIRGIRVDGSTFPVETSTRAYKVGDRTIRASSLRNITEQKRADAAVQESQARFQGLVETLSDWIWEVDPKGVYTYSSPTVKAILGYEPEEMLGKTPFDLMPPEEAKRVAGVFGPLLSTQQPLVALENINLRKDGRLVVLETSGLPFYDADGNFKGYRGTDRDITERKQAERTLQESEARYSAVVTQAQDGVVIIQDNILKFVNQALADMLGYTPAEIENTPIINYIAPASRALIVNRIKARLAGEEVPPVYEASLQRKDGTIIDTELSAGVIEYLGKPADVGMIRDITERKKTDEVIRESEDRFRRFTEATVEGLVFHEQGKIVDANPAALAMFGLSDNAEFIGKNLLEFLVPESHEPVLKQMQLENVLPYEVQCIRKGGSTFPVETSTRTYKIGDRTVRATSVRDITERKQAEADKLREKNVSDATINSLPGIFYMFDTQGNLVRRNRNYEIVAGYSEGETASRTALDAIAEEDRGRVSEAIRRAFTEGKVELEVLFQTRRGEKIPYFMTAVRMTIGDDMYVVGTGLDLSERKRLEQQIQTAYERRGYQVQLSTQVSQSIAAASSLEDLNQRVVTEVKERFGYYHTQLLRYYKDQDAVVLVTGYGETGAKMLAAGHRLPMGEGLIGTAASTGETVLRPTLENDPDWHPNPLLPDTKGEIAVPIKLGEDILGVLDVQSNTAGTLGSDDQLLLEG